MGFFTRKGQICGYGPYFTQISRKNRKSSRRTDDLELPEANDEVDATIPVETAEIDAVIPEIRDSDPCPDSEHLRDDAVPDEILRARDAGGESENILVLHVPSVLLLIDLAFFGIKLDGMEPQAAEHGNLVIVGIDNLCPEQRLDRGVGDVFLGIGNAFLHDIFLVRVRDDDASDAEIGAVPSEQAESETEIEGRTGTKLVPGAVRKEVRAKADEHFPVVCMQHVVCRLYPEQFLQKFALFGVGNLVELDLYVAPILDFGKTEVDNGADEGGIPFGKLFQVFFPGAASEVLSSIFSFPNLEVKFFDLKILCLNLNI